MASIFKQGTAASGDIDKLVTGDNAATVDVAGDKTLTIDLENCSYRTFDINSNNNIETLTITNPIMGSQAVVFIYTSNGIVIKGLNGSGVNEMSGTNLQVGYDTMTLSAGERAVMTICGTGGKNFVNLNKFAWKIY